jgi:hypothetical protein
MEALCKRFGIRISAETDRQYLLNVQQVTPEQRVS